MYEVQWPFSNRCALSLARCPIALHVLKIMSDSSILLCWYSVLRQPRRLFWCILINIMHTDIIPNMNASGVAAAKSLSSVPFTVTIVISFCAKNWRSFIRLKTDDEHLEEVLNMKQHVHISYSLYCTLYPSDSSCHFRLRREFAITGAATATATVPCCPWTS